MRRALLLACIGLLLPLDAPAGTPCVGLVLGGGGARGAAHIGVLKVLERERIPVCRIAGTSMGAIVGGLYASGLDASEIESILLAIDWNDVFRDEPARIDFPMRRKNDTLRYLLDFKIGVGADGIRLPAGVIQGQKLLTLLRLLTLHAWRIDDFDQLPIPLRVIATDIGRGEAVVFGEGDLGLAIRASMSVPAAFAPIQVDGKLLVDGGLADNVPVEVARAMGAERLVVVDVSAPLAEADTLNSPVSISLQMLDVLMRRRTEESLATLGAGDVVLRPQLGDIGSASFSRAAQAIPLGAAAAEAALPALRTLAMDAAAYAELRQRQRRRAADAPEVAFVDVLSARSRTAGYVDRELKTLENRPFDADALSAEIGHVYAQGNYELIDWRLREQNGRTGIAVEPVDKGWGPDFLTFGLQLSDDFQGRASYQLGAEYTRTGLNRRGGEWRTRVEIGRIAGLRSEFFQPTGTGGQFFALPYVDYRAVNQDIRVDGSVASAYRLRRASAGADFGWEPGTSDRVFLGLVQSHGSARALVGSTDGVGEFRDSSGSLRLGWVRDTLDDADFPSAGGRLDFLVTANLQALGSDNDAQIADFSWDHAFGFDRNTWVLGTRLRTVYGNPSRFDAIAPLGGFANLSGYDERGLLGQHLALFRGLWYRRLTESNALLSLPVYAGASVETGNAYDDRAAWRGLEGLILAGSVFVGLDSPFGPILLSYGRSNDGETAISLNFGTLLRPRL
ncbi:MAG: patatin-like phospholipase family protein [Rhodanobacteraceae bacterium]|nr:patatin-like phospholipase family protein [Rhodanobacteraceae bacterium]